MFCPSCGAAVQSGQKFCTACGSALTDDSASSAPTTATPRVETRDETTPPLGNPLPPPTVATSVAAEFPATSQMAAQHTTQQPTQPVAAWDVAGPDWQPTSAVAVVDEVRPFRMTPLLVASSLAAVLAVASAFVTVAAIEISGQPGLPTTETLYKLNDFSSNLMVGTIIAGLLLIVGASLGATGRRVGSGLAGGAGLALAGMMAMMLGQVTQLFDSTEFGLLSSGGSFTLTVTRDIGFWLAVIAALAGGAAFVLSFEASRPDGRPPVHPIIAAIGLLGTAMAVFGPMIPLNEVPFGDQFSNEFVPPATLLLRQLVLVLIAVGGVVGFTRNRRWGLGLALGAISVGAWQVITAATESGDIPLSYAGGNPGAIDFAPHAVTIIGVVAMVLAGVGGLLLAAQKRQSS